MTVEGRDEVAVPARLRRLWRLGATSRRGRPARLTVDQVVGTALDVADRDGLAGVTLTEVARRLGVTDMALYRHVESKDELLALLRDAGLGEPPPVAGEPSWREGLSAWAVAQRATYRLRPWLARIPISEPPIGPNEIAWMEAALDVLATTALGWADKLQVIGLIGGYVRSTTLLDQELAAGATASTRAGVERDYGRALATLVTADRYPQMARLVGSGLFAVPDGHGSAEDHDFAAGLTVILDGVSGMVDRAGS